MNPFEALTAAKTDADTLAALARGIDAEAEAPSPEALAAWWPECLDPAKAEAVARLQALARIAEPDAPGGLLDSLAYWTWAGWDEDEPARLFAHWPIPQPVEEGEPGGKLTPRTRWIRGGLSPFGLSRRWIEATPDARPAHPLAPIVRAWIKRPRPPGKRHVIAARERHPPKGKDPLILTRQPGLLALATHAPLEAVAVDGEAFATRTIGGVETKTRRYRLADSQGDLFPGPRKLAGNATAGAIFEAVAFMLLTGDERSPLRADLLRLANLAFALTGPTKWTESEGAVLVGGADTPPNRKRFNNALWALRGLGVQVRPGIWWRMAAADPDRGNLIGPADWWRDAMAGRLKDAPAAWRFTGCLFVPVSKWGAVERTVSGIESALAWGSSPGRGKRGRISDWLHPVRRGGPGPPVPIPWWQVLRLSGENVDAETPYKGAAGVRFGRRCADLERAGYFAPRTGTAKAGGTVEIVARTRPARGRNAGLIVRASARFCTAYGTNERVNLPAARLLTTGE